MSERAKYVAYSLETGRPKLIVNDQQRRRVRKYELLQGKRVFRFTPLAKGSLRIIK